MTDIALPSPLVGRYRIDRELGAGGMATVYLAYDLKHDRKVALKVLKPELAAVIGAQRFLSEIKTTANLQHAHILSLFDSGEVRPVRPSGAGDGWPSIVFYVMPFVEGESLRDRLNRERQLPIRAALLIAREVADALAYAHAHGVIHRDIKPENILLQDGHAVVADFGIALAASNTGGNRLTETGMSLGTPAYMSPEQAMGERSLDGRTDIYALGCVLYEMLVGEPPFTGPSAQAIVARVLTEVPRPISAQRGTVSPAVASAVEVALAKLPADRFGTATEFAAALEEGTTAATGYATRAASVVTPNARRGVAALAAVAVVFAALALWGWLRPQREGPVTRTFVAFPTSEQPMLGANQFTLLPNGSALVYVGPGPGRTQLWIKKRSELHATPLGGTAGAMVVFASPDGQWLGFIGDEKLKKVPSGGGDVTTIATAPCTSVACGQRQSAAWLDDGRIAFIDAAVMAIVASTGGPPDTVVTSAAIGGLAITQVFALPGSRGVLFTTCTLYCNKANILVVDLGSRTTRVLLENAMWPQYLASGHLTYVAPNGTAMAIPFDLRTLTTHGTVTPLIEHVAGPLSIASNGTVAYVDGDITRRSELVRVDRNGNAQPIDTTWRVNFSTIALSPDGRRVAASVVAADGQEHIWVKSLSDGAPLRLTFGASQSTSPTWTADGASILFTRFEGTGKSQFMMKPADGTGAERLLQSGNNWVIESAVSRDGAWLLTREYRAGARDIYARRTSGDTTEHAIVQTPLDDLSPTLSPDGRWLAYVAEEAGSRDVWVVPFPDAHGARWQVSANGGMEPTWSADGRELFYVSPSNELVAAQFAATGSSFAVTSRRDVFRLDGYHRHPTHRAYEVMPDGSFLMIRDGTPTRGELVIVDHWAAEMRARLSP